MLATVPGQTAAVFVAFAAIGGMPVKIRAGKVMKLPPPATELIVPASTAAKNRKIGSWMLHPEEYIAKGL